MGGTGAFDRVSQWARKGFVSLKTYDHASIVRFLEAKFRLPGRPDIAR